jgi:hypothetical protein
MENLRPHDMSMSDMHEMRRENGRLQRELADAKAALSSRPTFSNTGTGILNEGADIYNPRGGTGGTVSEANMSIVRPPLHSGRSCSPKRSHLRARPIFHTEHHSSGESRDGRYETTSDSLGHMRGVRAPPSQASGDRQFQTGTGSFVDQYRVADNVETPPRGNGQHFVSEATNVTSVQEPGTSNRLGGRVSSANVGVDSRSGGASSGMATQYRNNGAPLTSQQSGRPKRPATYDGKSNWPDYLVHFELTAEMNRWDDISKAMELATSLRDAAQSVLVDLDPQQRRSYEVLVSALESRFGPGRQTELYRAQLKYRLRKKHEPINELAQDVKRLVRLAYPTAPVEVRDQLTRDSLLDALNDSELEWAVYQVKPKTVDDAIQLSIEYEAFQDSHKRRFGKSDVRMQYETPAIDEIRGRIAKLEVEKQGNCHRCGESGHWKRECGQDRLESQGRGANPATLASNETQGPMRRPFKGNCHYCGEGGHWKRECRQRQIDRQNKNYQYTANNSQQGGNTDNRTPAHRSGNGY